ncbi:MEDS domain-containing protein [Nonomuraea sp. NPDC049419]|uniref:MEDS domain-containing protein n=1 Tax=Nonomuraea sp. NPDC049419 TaxID=3155772 RepID=UPI00343D327A
MPVQATVRAGDHVAARFGSDAAFADLAVEFACNGVTARGQVLLFVPRRLRRLIGDRLAASAPLRAAARDGHVRVVDPRDVQLAGGFDAARLHTAYHDATQAALIAGYPGLWVVVDMSWARPSVVDPEALVAFEAASITLFTEATLTALCAFDTRVFTAKQVFRVCQAHPVADAAGFGHRATPDGCGLALSGETDRSNALAWKALLAALAPDHHVVDISGMSFLSVRAMADLGAAARVLLRPLTVRATRAQATHLRLLHLDDLITIDVLPPQTTPV